MQSQQRKEECLMLNARNIYIRNVESPALRDLLKQVGEVGDKELLKERIKAWRQDWKDLAVDH